MPVKRSDRKRKRTVTRKRKINSSKKVSRPTNKNYGKIQRNMFGVSPNVIGVHSYGQNYSFSCGPIGAFGTSQVWNLNTLFDPDQSGIGHQQYLRDEYANVYSRYKVLRCKVDLMIVNPSADGIIICGQFRSPANTVGIAGFTPQVVMERPGVFTKVINNTGKQIVKFSKDVSIQSISGLTKAQFDADVSNFSAAVTLNPAFMPTLVLAVAALDEISTPSVNIITKLTFYTMWYDRKTVNQS